MYKSASDTGYDVDDTRRFDLLQYLNFDSILDVGSGPCLLKTWLTNHNKSCVYEAVDIREESLALCSCPSYTSIPDKQYDVVCLFGTCGYISPEIDNKKVLYSLLTKSIKQSKKYLIFSVIINVTSQRVISFTADEIIKFLNDLGITKYKTFIHEKNSECIIFCEIC
jgi:hypothetical protein